MKKGRQRREAVAPFLHKANKQTRESVEARHWQRGGVGGGGYTHGEHSRSCRPQHLTTPDQRCTSSFVGNPVMEKRYAREEAGTVKPYRAVKPLAVILLWVRFRLQSCDRRAKCPRAASVMPTLCAREREVREGMREMTAAPTSVTRPPHTSRDSSFCRFLHHIHTHSLV